MTASNELICFPVWPLPETAIGLLCNCLMGALIAMHGRSRMTLDLRIHTRPSHPAGTEHVGFSPTRQALLAPNEAP